MRFLLSVLFVGVAMPALAHTGHLVDVAGHDHWLAGAAIGTAIAIALWGALKGRSTAESDAAEQDADAGEGDDEMQEA